VVLLGGEHHHHLPTVGRDLCQRFGFLIGDEPRGLANGLGKVGEDQATGCITAEREGRGCWMPRP
jgi:hypothetical protein